MTGGNRARQKRQLSNSQQSISPSQVQPQKRTQLERWLEQSTNLDEGIDNPVHSDDMLSILIKHLEHQRVKEALGSIIRESLRNDLDQLKIDNDRLQKRVTDLEQTNKGITDPLENNTFPNLTHEKTVSIAPL